MRGGVAAGALGSVENADNSLYTRLWPQAWLRKRLTNVKALFLYPMQLTATELAVLLAWPELLERCRRERSKYYSHCLSWCS